MSKKSPMVVGLLPETKGPERKPRLTIRVRHSGHKTGWIGRVFLDDRTLFQSSPFGSEPEARAAAQAYVDELKAHFREGGS